MSNDTAAQQRPAKQPAAAGRIGVCAPLGFRAGAAAASIRGAQSDAKSDAKSDRLDIALVLSDHPAAATGVFTRNVVKAAPVVISELTLRRNQPMRAVVLNAGNANACTGAQGLKDALVMCKTTAEAVELDPTDILVCSTGVIGRPLPMDRVVSGIHAAATTLGSDGAPAADAIMTTDTRRKTAVAEFQVGERTYTVGGMAKGSGMIHPDMATLLGVITTDAPIAEGKQLAPMLRGAVEDTFNCVTVDGDTSTNDAVLLLANGAAGGDAFDPTSEAMGKLAGAIHTVCLSLAEQVVADGEGATKYFQVRVGGAPDTAGARIAARTVAASPLVKTAIHGNDPNWGRIVAALGRSGIRFALDRCRVTIGGTDVYLRGVPQQLTPAEAAALFADSPIVIDVDLGVGEASGRAWGCDLSADYVHINADYTT